MRYLSLLLLGPWLVMLAWAYWVVEKRFRVTWQLKLYDVMVVLMALGVACGSALVAFDDIAIQNVGGFGRESGGIWKQVMPALYGYGAFAAVMVLGIVMRLFLRRHESHFVAQKRG
ncbi:hypothetical protein [Dyella flagellata]|uniref:Uncharacterized protein n=1 Tax=Dyella flagellata TaxID=1867833 RepID=A0ABQ5X9L4_9GAMM|nr:hypothetical protein [Dyella flagellata]GLQ88312.1 hypothetical protein GCM10007898_18810 [Dyella flagellata]